MKLSEMSTESLCRALCEMAPPVGALAEDERLGGIVESLAREREGGAAAVAAFIAQATPLLLGDHLRDVCAILAVLTGKAEAEIRAQPGVVTLREARQCWDGELAAFFGSAGSTAQAPS